MGAQYGLVGGRIIMIIGTRLPTVTGQSMSCKNRWSFWNIHPGPETAFVSKDGFALDLIIGEVEPAGSGKFPVRKQTDVRILKLPVSVHAEHHVAQDLFFIHFARGAKRAGAVSIATDAKPLPSNFKPVGIAIADQSGGLVKSGQIFNLSHEGSATRFSGRPHGGHARAI